jgi:hypothetical protein
MNNERQKYIIKHKCGLWQVQIWFSSKNHYLGLYPTIEDAIKTRDHFLKTNGINKSATYESHYAENKEMLYEMIVSQSQGRLTNKLLLICMKIVKGVSKKFRYKDTEDRFDCEAYCYEMIIKNWMMFDLDNYENVFSWVTQIVKNGFAMQFKILQKSRLDTISLDYTNSEGNSIQNYI